jgi:nitrogen fixation-related uncharacterized protein
MTIILVLFPLSFVLLSLAGAASFRAVDNEQYDDMDTPALMPLTADKSDASRVKETRGAAWTGGQDLQHAAGGRPSAPCSTPVK